MQMGLLWFDSDPNRDIAAKALDAARRYRERFGAQPDTCYVNSGALNEERWIPAGGAGDPGLRVIPANHILAHHFWIGVEERHERSTP